MNEEQYKKYMEFWLPILKKQTFKAILQEDLMQQLDIKENIYKNTKLKDYKKEILKEIGIKI